MHYFALLLGMISLGMLYLPYQWEEDQYEEIGEIMDDDTVEVMIGNSKHSGVGDWW